MDFDALERPGERIAPVDDDESAYRNGYARILREVAWIREHGHMPTERQLVLALMQAVKVYDTVRGGRSIGGRHPEWLRGRADALRALVRSGAADGHHAKN